MEEETTEKDYSDLVQRDFSFNKRAPICDPGIDLDAPILDYLHAIRCRQARHLLVTIILLIIVKGPWPVNTSLSS